MARILIEMYRLDFKIFKRCRIENCKSDTDPKEKGGGVGRGKGEGVFHGE
jgi:hypothetical protein